MKITNKPSFYYTEDGRKVDTFQVEFAPLEQEEKEMLERYAKLLRDGLNK